MWWTCWKSEKILFLQMEMCQWKLLLNYKTKITCFLHYFFLTLFFFLNFCRFSELDFLLFPQNTIALGREAQCSHCELCQLGLAVVQQSACLEPAAAGTPRSGASSRQPGRLHSTTCIIFLHLYIELYNFMYSTATVETLDSTNAQYHKLK